MRTGVVEDTGISGKNPAIYGAVIAFETSEPSILEDLNSDGDTNDLVIRYYNLETQTVTSTGAVGMYPAVYKNYIAFATPEEDINKDLNGDGKFLGNVIQYYNSRTGNVVNTQKLGTEPDIDDDTITFYLWEMWACQDINGNGSLNDPIIGTYRIAVTEMVIVCPWVLLILVITGCMAVYFKRRK